MNRILSMSLAGLLLAASVVQAADRRNEIQAPRTVDEIQAPADPREAGASR